VCMRTHTHTHTHTHIYIYIYMIHSLRYNLLAHVWLRVPIRDVPFIAGFILLIE